MKNLSGNYTSGKWVFLSLALKQPILIQNKKSAGQAKELQAFIDRFSANVAKSKQATARKKMIENWSIDEIELAIAKEPLELFSSQSVKPGDQIFMNRKSGLKADGVTYFTDVNLMVDAKAIKSLSISQTKAGGK